MIWLACFYFSLHANSHNNNNNMQSVPAVMRRDSFSMILINPVLQDHPFLAVAFYAPGCGRCRRLHPSWTRAAELLDGAENQEGPPRVQLGRMDITSSGGMAAWKAFGLQRVPTVKARVRRGSVGEEVSIASEKYD